MASNVKSLVTLLLTSVFFIVGIFLDYMPILINSKIKTSVELATNKEILSIWSKPPVEFHSFYWLYEVLNVEQFMAGEKVQVRKVGPYHFTSQLEKKIIDVSQNKYRITFNSTRNYYLNDSKTELILDEQLKLLNPIYASMLEGSRNTAFYIDDPQMKQQIYSSASRLMERFNESLFINLTARSALLGRQVPFLSKIKKLITTFGIDIKLPETLDGDIFGYIAIQNNTNLGPFEIYTGYQETMKSLGDLISFKGKRRNSEFKGKCNRIQASIGELRPMPIYSNQILELWQPQLCRIVHLKPNLEKKLREGMAISYSFAQEDFLSASENPDNNCFCINRTKLMDNNNNNNNTTSQSNQIGNLILDNNFNNPYLNDNYCSLNGVIELAPCSYYSPIILTVNNMDLDPKITDSILNWEPELRNSEVDLLKGPDKLNQFTILKRIGVPLSGDVTITLFMKIARDPKFRQTANIPEVSYIPILMVRETGSIPPKLAKIIINLENFIIISQHFKIVMYLSSIILLCWLTSFYYGRTKRDRIVPTNNNGDDDDNSNNNNQGGAFSPSTNNNNQSDLEREETNNSSGNNNGNAIEQQQGDAREAGNGEANLQQETKRFSMEKEANILEKIDNNNNNNIGKSNGISSDSELELEEQRANSADSNRSLPPSRVSRSSLDDVLFNSAENGNSSNGESNPATIITNSNALIDNDRKKSSITSNNSGEGNSKMLDREDYSQGKEKIIFSEKSRSNLQGAQVNANNNLLVLKNERNSAEEADDGEFNVNDSKSNSNLIATIAASLISNSKGKKKIPNFLTKSSKMFSKVDELRWQQQQQQNGIANLSAGNGNGANFGKNNLAAGGLANNNNLPDEITKLGNEEKMSNTNKKTSQPQKVIAHSNAENAQQLADDVNVDHNQKVAINVDYNNNNNNNNNKQQKAEIDKEDEGEIVLNQVEAENKNTNLIVEDIIVIDNNNNNVVNGKSKSWFMKVCSNFVRMLNGFRGSIISDVGQLNVSENNNDYQDKQLEMLAGKIDNWYSGISSNSNFNNNNYKENENENDTSKPSKNSSNVDNIENNNNNNNNNNFSTGDASSILVVSSSSDAILLEQQNGNLMRNETKPSSTSPSIVVANNNNKNDVVSPSQISNEQQQGKEIESESENKLSNAVSFNDTTTNLNNNNGCDFDTNKNVEVGEEGEKQEQFSEIVIDDEKLQLPSKENGGIIIIDEKKVEKQQLSNLATSNSNVVNNNELEGNNKNEQLKKLDKDENQMANKEANLGAKNIEIEIEIESVNGIESNAIEATNINERIEKTTEELQMKNQEEQEDLLVVNVENEKKSSQNEEGEFSTLILDEENNINIIKQCENGKNSAKSDKTVITNNKSDTSLDDSETSNTKELAEDKATAFEQIELSLKSSNLNSSQLQLPIQSELNREETVVLVDQNNKINNDNDISELKTISISQIDIEKSKTSEIIGKNIIENEDTNQSSPVDSTSSVDSFLNPNPNNNNNNNNSDISNNKKREKKNRPLIQTSNDNNNKKQLTTSGTESGKPPLQLLSNNGIGVREQQQQQQKIPIKTTVTTIHNSNGIKVLPENNKANHNQSTKLNDQIVYNASNDINSTKYNYKLNKLPANGVVVLVNSNNNNEITKLNSTNGVDKNKPNNLILEHVSNKNTKLASGDLDFNFANGRGTSGGKRGPTTTTLRASTKTTLKKDERRDSGYIRST